MKIVIAPDSFKGTLPALHVAQAIADGIRNVLADADIKILPMADGGEGTLDAILFATQGEKRSVQVSNARGFTISANYGVLRDALGETAILEAAQVVGLNDAGDSDVMQRSTRGLGELIRHCLDKNIRRFMIGVGGSSTNDGGSGTLAALGVRFLDEAGENIPATPEGLARLHRLDFYELDTRLKQCDITLMTDVDIPLCGAQGATAIFGPQKGVRQDQIDELDNRLAHYAKLADAWQGSALSEQAGSGAAGGLGYALMLIGAARRPGAEVVCELMHLDEALRDADWVITGEGKSDAQTLRGKLPIVVARHARNAQVKTLLLSAVIDDTSRAELSELFNACYAVVGEGISTAQALRETAVCLRLRAQQLVQELLK